MAEKPSTVDAYLAGFTGTHHSRLTELRGALRAAVLDAHEKISYGMPAISIRKNVIYYAAWEKHVAVYGWLGAEDAFLEPLKSYISSKGTLKFPLDVALPLDDLCRLAAHLAERCR
jgi:uncharacterized protein YdhG (YjbR/CyaY superfamily)